MPTARRVYAMLENESLWDTARQCHEVLAAAEVPHAVMGGVAVCLHGYQRNTVDLDLLVRKEDAEQVRQALTDAGYSWNKLEAEFRSPAGIPVQFLISGEKAGKDAELVLPDPSDRKVVEDIEGLPVLTLARLIETKIACGQGNLRRSHKDFADVVELIAIHRLGTSFARNLHKSLRATFRQLVGHAHGD